MSDLILYRRQEPCPRHFAAYLQNRNMEVFSKLTEQDACPVQSDAHCMVLIDHNDPFFGVIPLP